MSFGTASYHSDPGVELLNEVRGPQGCLFQSNSEYREVFYGSETWGDNLLGQKGNNPDRQLRSQSIS